MTSKTKRGPQRIPFTKRNLEALEPPAAGRRYVYDERQPGLCVCLTAAGTKTFYYYAKVNGQPQRNRIGPFPSVPIETARAAAKGLAGEVAKGRDPMEEKRAARQQPTLAEAWESFLTWGTEHKRPGSIKEDKALYESFLEHWKGRRLAKITRGEVQTLHTRIGSDNGKVRANRVLALLSSLFNHARDIGFTGGNPCTGIRRFKEVARDRYLLPTEIQPFFKALAAELPVFRDLFAVCLLTGQRSGNVKSMRWADVNLEAATWRIPPDDAKAGEAIVCPLTPLALEILRQRKAADDNGPWVFPGRSGSKAGHIAEPKEAWKRICKRAGLEGLRIHDLRRSSGSWQAALGASLHVIGKALGHRNQATTAIYAQLDTSPVRQSLTAAEAALLTAAGDSAKLLTGATEEEEGGDNVDA
jgi:integrase